MKMRRLSISPVVLAIGASVAVGIASLIVLFAVPGNGPSRFTASQWWRVLLVEAACIIPLLFVQMKVRGARWLWLIWLVAAVEYTRPEVSFLWRSAYSLVPIAIYLGWAVKFVVAAMLFVRGNSTPGMDAGAEMPNHPSQPSLARG